jgi:hypothetical protein
VKKVSSQDSVLSDELLGRLIAMGEVDVLVGLATYNNAGTVGHVVRAAQTAFAKYFHRERTALLVVDAGSRDDTLDAVRRSQVPDTSPVLASFALRTVHQIAVPYHGVPGKASALRSILAAAELSRARACVVVGADHGGVTPEGIGALIRAVRVEGFDFVSPLYRRQKLEGLLPKNLVSPVIRGVYGLSLREPLGGEIALSARLISNLLGQSFWEVETVRSGIDLSLPLAAAVEGFRLCELALGRWENGRAGRVALGTVVEQIVGSLFTCLDLHQQYWQSADRQALEVAVEGTLPDIASEPTRINRRHMLHRFRSAVSDLGSVLENILAAETLGEIRALAARDDREIRFPDELWARTVYDCAASYHGSVIHRAHVLQALTPLYLGRAGSFLLENLDRDAAHVDRRLEELCLAFERLKPYLLERWKAMEGR